MLPGLMMPPGLMAGGGGSKEITFKSSITYRYNNPTWPIPSVAAGDIIIVCMGNDGGSTNYPAVPSGFTNLGYAQQGWYGDSGGQATRLAAKVATGSESGANVKEGSPYGNTNYECVILVFSYGAASLTAGTPAQTGSNNDPAAQTILSGSASGPCIAVGSYGSTGTITSNTATPSWDAVISTSNGFRVGYKIFNASPVNISFDMGDHGNANRLVGTYISLT